MAMRILLVDDEKLQLLRLKKAVDEALPGEVEILTFSNPKEAWDSCREKPCDLAFLDIEMPGMNGIQLAKKLKEANPQTNIVFVTAYDQYALDAFRIHASGYLNKPVSKQKVEVELANLRNPIVLPKEKKLQVKCFGNFEIFHNGEPVSFSYVKSKEVFAYLVDREGAAISLSELNAILWEEDHSSYLRNLIADIRATLEKLGVGEVFSKRRNACFIDVEQIDCDAYEYKKGNPDAIRMYRGEYMIQYPWALFKD